MITNPEIAQFFSLAIWILLVVLIIFTQLNYQHVQDRNNNKVLYISYQLLLYIRLFMYKLRCNK